MYSILIVDDEPIVKIALRSILPWEEHGFSICGTASNGLEALPLIEQHHPDVIITDLKMPKMDGHHLTKMIKDDPILKAIPVSLFSSLINEQMRIKGESVGADGQFSKPQIGQLIQYLDEHI